MGFIGVGNRGGSHVRTTLQIGKADIPVRNRVICPEGDYLSAFQFVQGNANLLGGEIIVDIHPHPFDWLHFENSFSMNEIAFSK